MEISSAFNKESLSKSICIYGSNILKNLLICIGASRSNSRPLVVILWIIKCLRFINLSNQPFKAEKFPFARIRSASARIILVVTHKSVQSIRFLLSDIDTCKTQPGILKTALKTVQNDVCKRGRLKRSCF
jgi:hypothetical protein